jgi:AraC family transcriptional regulator
MPAYIVDFAREKEAGYQRIFARSPLLSSAAVNWQGVYVAYDYFQPGQTPEICLKQHALAIFTDLPEAVQVERQIGGKLRHEHEQVNQGDLVIVPAETWHCTGADRGGGAVVIGLEPNEMAQKLATAVEVEQMELLTHFATPDPLIHQMGLALKQTLQNLPTTSQLYAESLTNALMVHLLQHYSTQQLKLPVYSGGLAQFRLRPVIDYRAPLITQKIGKFSTRDQGFQTLFFPKMFGF